LIIGLTNKPVLEVFSLAHLERSAYPFCRLQASPETTCIGYFDNQRSGALLIASGQTVWVETLNHFGDGVDPKTSTTDIVEFRKQTKDRGPHTVTGPIFIEGAMPGDSLAVVIGRIQPRRHGYNFHLPGTVFPTAGALPDEFPDGLVRHFELDPDGKRILFAPGIHIPLRPFPGIIGVSPPDRQKITTVFPGAFGGNMDLKELTEGTVLFLPVFVEGALLWVGDGHAAQGDGEVNITAVECAFESVELTISVRKGATLKLPRAETASHWITMGFHPDLEEAFRTALREMLGFLCSEKGMSRPEAYSLCSVAVDFRITQVVNGNKGVHGMLPKAIFDNEK
jgi:acetamidase/formamidase